MKNISRKILIIIFIIVSICITGCGVKKTDSQQTPQTETAEKPADTQESDVSYVGKIVISEIMPKNKATIRDQKGEFTDWIELENVSDETINLNGWTLETGKETTVLDDTNLAPGQFLLIYAVVDNGGTTELFDAEKIKVDSWNVPDLKSDRSAVLDADGNIVECLYPTPGMENTGESFDTLQESRNSTGALEIYEVCVEDFHYIDWEGVGYCDWVEIKNISDSTVNTKDWYLTDDLKNAFQYNLGDFILDPGESYIIPCEKDATEKQIMASRFAAFSLDSDNEKLYLISPEGDLVDYTPLKDIPYGMTYGRIDGKNGFFYLNPTPEKNNSESAQCARRVCKKPSAVSKDGVFNDVTNVEVKLSSDYDIYYTVDGSTPTTESEKYTGPFKVNETCIVKAVAVEEGTINSRPLVLSYIINMENTLPVVSVVADDYRTFKQVYDNANKYIESPGYISYYGEDGTFSMGAGIKLHGFSTLHYHKPNMSFRFRGCYGSEQLNYDVFGDGQDGGVTHFSNLLLRGGGDQYNTIVKNEVFLDLAKEFSDNIYCSRYKYVAVYLNGEYRGIYALMDKNNEQWFADINGVSKDSVILTEDPAYSSNQYYQDVLDLVFYHDIKDPEIYDRLCKLLDIDSLIDWTLIEGFSANWDLESGNLKYAKSSESDGKWKYIMYDLDNSLYNGDSCFCYVLNYYNQVSALNGMLMKNPSYKEKFLERASYALKNVLTVENLWKHYEEVSAVIDKEAKIDKTISYESWQKHLKEQKKILFEDYNWYECCVDEIAFVTKLNAEEKQQWFGDYKVGENNTASSTEIDAENNKKQ